MYCEIPECKRCCCCLPLRYGVLVWAYLKMLFWIVLLENLFESLYRMYVVRSPANQIEELMMWSNFFVVSINCLATILCIVAVHMKHLRLSSIYIKCELVSIFGNAFLLILNLAVMLWYYIIFLLFLRPLIIATLLFFIFMGTQIYVVLLVRTKMQMLARNGGFQFENNGAEAECTYYSPDDVERYDVMNDVKGTGDVNQPDNPEVEDNEVNEVSDKSGRSSIKKIMDKIKLPKFK